MSTFDDGIRDSTMQSAKPVMVYLQLWWSIHNKKHPTVIGVVVDQCTFPKRLRTMMIFISLFSTHKNTLNC